MAQFRYPRPQWCELHHGTARDVRAMQIGTHAAERYTVMICTECAKDLNKLGWIYTTPRFKWDYVFPNVERYRGLAGFLWRAR